MRIEFHDTRAYKIQPWSLFWIDKTEVQMHSPILPCRNCWSGWRINKWWPNQSIHYEQPSKPFHYYDWAEFLSALFMPVPLITSYYHFRFSHTQPGVVFVREFADSEEKKIIIIRSGTTIDKSALPVTLTPSGLSQERKQYLFEHIRPFCDEEYRNITCPEPRARKRHNSQEQGPSTKQSKRLCSHCRMPGHTKTVKGEITCPTLLKECPQ